MDMYRAFLAILISFVILLGWQYFFVGPTQQPVETATEQAEQVQPQEPQPATPAAQQQIQTVQPKPAAQAARPARELIVDTDLYTATLSENGGVLTSFLLKDYQEEKAADAPGVNLVKTTAEQGFPLAFSWGSGFSQDTLYTFDSTEVQFSTSDNSATVSMRAINETGLEVVRTYVFKRDSYLIDHSVTVSNRSSQPLQGAAGLYQRNMPFGPLNKASKWLFRGPTLFNSEAGLQRFKLKDFEDGAQTLQSTIDWAAYQGTYFMTGIIPEPTPLTITMNAVDELVTIDLVGGLDTLGPGAEKTYAYKRF
jgi:YidC/Oxa1 family membrane protein insertase